MKLLMISKTTARQAFSQPKFMKQIVILVVGHLIVRITLKFLFGLSFLFLVYFFPVLND